MLKWLKFVVERRVLFMVRRQMWKARRFEIFESAHHFQIELNRDVRFESNLQALQVPNSLITRFLLLYAVVACSGSRYIKCYVQIYQQKKTISGYLQCRMALTYCRFLRYFQWKIHWCMLTLYAIFGVDWHYLVAMLQVAMLVPPTSKNYWVCTPQLLA